MRPKSTQRLGRLASVLCIVSASLSGWLYVSPTARGGLATNLIGYGLKILSGALSPVLSLMGLVGALVARRERRPFAALLGWAGAVLGVRFLWRVRSAGDSDTNLTLWGESATPEHTMHHATRIWRHTKRRPRVIRDLAFATVPGSERVLLCDLWEPGKGVPRSHLGVIYLHGGAWQAFDKDTMTRPFFRHLTAQGHVVMDVAYRMARETDMLGMLGDTKRALAWLKSNGAYLDVDPARVVLAGGSAGGHLAVLAAYTPNDPDCDPEDTREIDTSVRGVVAYYPVADLRTLTRHWSEQSMHPLATALGIALGFFPREGYLPWSRLAPQLFGASPDDAVGALLAFSPVAHVGPHCPPTLILQGLHDHVIPVGDVRRLHAELRAAGRPASIVELPMVEHAFDMIALHISPPARTALRHVDRFLAQLA